MDLSSENNSPHVPPHVILPEITLKAIVLGIILATLLGASNTYLALKVGMTVAASIPASVIALTVFRFFKTSNILETNLVQTAASAGEGLAAAMTFILPSLLILGYWSGFLFWQTASMAILGGLLGVLFSVFLRRMLLSQRTLPFPEGTAVGNVLRASTDASTGRMGQLIRGSIVGGLIVFLQSGLQLVGSALPLWAEEGNILFGTTLGFDPTLIGAGYIIGIQASLALLVGLISCWVIGVPLLCIFYGLPTGDTPYHQVMALWNTKIRYIGVGTMIIGGLWYMISLFTFMLQGVVTVYQAFKRSSPKKQPIAMLRTEKDFSPRYAILGILIILVLSFILITINQAHSILGLSSKTILIFSSLSVLSILVLGFFSSLICGYLVGLIGSTNTPLSGVIIISLLFISLMLLPCIIDKVDMHVLASQKAAIALLIFVLAIIGSTACITVENIQDLKAGAMIGATPWKQQLMMMLGVVVSSIVIAPVMQLLFQAYGIGGVYPRPGMNPAHMLAAPQAALIASLGQAILGHDLPWPMLSIGIAIGIICIFIDQYLKRRGKFLAVLAVGLGIYLPPEIITPTIIGGLVHYIANCCFKHKIKTVPSVQHKELIKASYERGTILACGLVAGSALMGVFLAIPFVISGNSDILRLAPPHFDWAAKFLGTIMVVFVTGWLIKVTCKIK